MRLANVQNYGLVELVGQIELPVEYLLLYAAGGEVVMVVQTDFAQRDHLVHGHPFADQPGMRVRPQRRVVRMYARGGVEKVVFARERKRVGRTPRAVAHDYGAANAGLAHAGDDFSAVALKSLVVDVAMRVKQLQHGFVSCQFPYFGQYTSRARIPRVSDFEALLEGRS